MRKLRIVKGTDGNGEVTYKIQDKGLFWWRDLGGYPYPYSHAFTVKTYESYNDAMDGKRGVIKHDLSYKVEEEVVI